MSITVIGAGKTGRGFIGRLLAESNRQIRFIDKNAALVAELNAKKQFRISFFGGKREDFAVANYTASTWEDVKTVEDELILVSVCGPNLPDVGAALKTRLDPEKHYYIITAENSSKPAKVLKEAIGMENVSVSESTVFCTTIEKDGLNISSENYPYLQCDADLLEGYVPKVKGIRPVGEFGNFLTRKLFTYNAASCVIAYLGWLRGYTDYGEAANDPEILELLDRNYAATNKALCKEFGYEEKDQAEFAALSKVKFTDRTIVDTVARNAREPQRKLGANERVIGPMLLLHKYGEDTEVLEMTAAAMLCYDNEGEDKWRAIKAEKDDATILTEIGGVPADHPCFARIMAHYDVFCKK
jgi:mannitol-1-phosphate 5-dehydrogenase